MSLTLSPPSNFRRRFWIGHKVHGFISMWLVLFQSMMSLIASIWSMSIFYRRFSNFLWFQMYLLNVVIFFSWSSWVTRTQNNKFSANAFSKKSNCEFSQRSSKVTYTSFWSWHYVVSSGINEFWLPLVTSENIACQKWLF